MPFTHHCTVCDKVQLIFPSQGHAVTPTDEGVEMAFTCWCGAEQAHVVADPTSRRGDVTLVA